MRLVLDAAPITYYEAMRGAKIITPALSSTIKSARAIPLGWLLAILTAWLGGGQLLLWRFLDIAPWWAYAPGLSGLATLCVAIIRLVPAPPDSSVSIRILSVAFLVSFILFLLGGEGRFFYANIDWQVRNAVLRDMGINPWPFVYTARPIPDVLRAPIGMFLAPALAFKAFGARAGDIALLIQNSAILAILFGLGSRLFASTRQRFVALIIFLFFSGLDVLGQWFIFHTLIDNLEKWAGIQYSSTITLAFWVPHHALAGWICALLFLLWRSGRLPVGIFFAIMPLTALWSPLALLGGLPFAAIAGVTTLWKRTLTRRDILLPGLVCLLCVPSLLYLAAAGDDVGMRPYPINWLRYVIFQMLETAPYLVPLALIVRRNRFGSATFTVVTLCLLLMPFIQIGWDIDFMMRASIPALAILAVMVTDAVIGDADPAHSPLRLWLMLILAIGSVTGASSIRRAVIQSPAPLVTCTFFKAWDQSFKTFPKGSYLAPLPEMPALIRPENPARASAAEPERCWPGIWYHRSSQPSGQRDKTA